MITNLNVGELSLRVVDHTLHKGVENPLHFGDVVLVDLEENSSNWVSQANSWMIKDIVKALKTAWQHNAPSPPSRHHLHGICCVQMFAMHELEQLPSRTHLSNASAILETHA
jgi:hypothetical protein